VECSGTDFRTRLGVTDGTPAGTRLVTSHQPPEMPWDKLDTREDVLPKYWGPDHLTALGNAFLFQDATGQHGYEVWKTDGASSAMVLDIMAGGGYGADREFLRCGESVLLEGQHLDTGRELWRSDGTAAGTRLVKDIYPGLAGSAIKSPVDVGGTLFFGAGDPEHGMELWMSGGTEDTTGRLTDINPGVASGGPAGIARLGDNLVFFASNGTDAGTGLWGMQMPLLQPGGTDGTGGSTASIRWMWEDPSARELGFRIWSDPGTERPVTLRHETAADVTAWLQTGLPANTQHTFQVAAFEEGAESLRSAPISAWTLIEPLRGLAFSAVGPDRITVSAASPAPSNLSAGHSGLRFFNLGSGTSSDWLQDNAGWAANGLTADTPYVFSGRSRNGDMVTTAPAIGMIRTLAWPAAAPVVDQPTGTTLRVALGPAVGNPAHTTYGIRVILPGGDLGWVTAGGTVGTSPVFLTAEAWGVTTVTGLADGSPYGFRVVSRNGDGIWSPPGPATTAWTLDVTPPTAEILLPDRNPNNEAAVRFTVRFSESVGGSFDTSDVTLTGTLAGTASALGEGLEYVVTVTLSDLSASGEVGILLGTDIQDLAGKPFAGMESAHYTLLRWDGFASHPEPARLYRGEDHLLSVTVNAGYAPTAFQWFKETPDKGVETGPAGPEWPLENATSGHAGVYWCEVTDGGVVYSSPSALVEVAEPLVITEEPADAVGYTGRSAMFRVGVSGGFAPVRVQWRKDGGVVAGAESPECWLQDVTFDDAGLYSAEVSDGHTALLETRHAELTVIQGVPTASTVWMIALLAASLAVMGALLAPRRSRRG
jgi:ELWxxDGT repeat protein